jgi:elongator complex protein 4
MIDSIRNETTPVRIILPDFGSPIWKDTSGKELFCILFQLKILVNRYPACCTLQLPAYLYNDQTYVSVNPDIQRLEHLADAVLELESFSGTKRILHPAYTQSTPSQPPYHGLLHVIKLFAIKTLLPPSRRQFSPSQLDSLAFRVRRKRLTIEPFHLPPEEEDPNNESMSHLSLNEPSGCGSGHQASKLDF